MEIDLPSGHKVSLRDTFMRGDLVAARKALTVDIDPDGTRHMTLAVEEEVRGAILRAMIVEWTFPAQLPRDAATPALAEGILNTVLDADDNAVLGNAIQKFYLQVMRTGSDESPNSRSGATVISISAEPDGQGILST